VRVRRAIDYYDDIAWDIMQEEVYPHPLTWQASKENKTILRKKGDYVFGHYVFGNKVFNKGKHVILMELDLYQKDEYY